MMKPARCGFAFILTVAMLAGCQASESRPASAPAQDAEPVPLPDGMEARCKDNVSWRYNTNAQNVSVTDVQTWQGSYELRGYTDREERFTCSFDTHGTFMHLSMR